MSAFRNRWLLVAVSMLTAVPASAQSSALEGELQFAAHCARCHQQDGAGLPPLYPALVDSALLRQAPVAAIRSVMSGRHGVNALGDGVSVMPAHGDLANETIAAILNYAGTTWGSGAWALTATDVAAERNAIMRGAPIEHPTLDYESNRGALADLDVTPYVTSKGPAMTMTDYRRAATTYYTHCTGCHGVMRQGLPGIPLTPDVMRQRGSEYLRAVINYGAAISMPNWGTSERLSSDDVAGLAHFLQHPVPRPPEFSMAEIRASWQQPNPTFRRPSARSRTALFAVALHDTGQVAFFDAAKRRLVAVVDVGLAPHLLRASGSGRYLVVVSRGGWITLIDSYGKRPRMVARVRVGFEARAVGVARYPGFEDRFVLAGALWPPQMVLVDGLTLEPLQLIKTPAEMARSTLSHPAPRVTDIIGSTQRPEFVAVVKDTGKFHLVPFDNENQPLREVDAVTNLRAGSLNASGRYLLVPSDRGNIAVLDTKTQSLAAVAAAARLAGGSRGTLAEDPYYGPVWLTSSMANDAVTMIGADPVAHGPFAWQSVRVVRAHAAGSITATGHAKSRHVWIDTPFAQDPSARGRVSVLDMDRPDAAPRVLPIAVWAGVEGPLLRALQPAFSSDGSEVWVLVWNEAAQTSAIVVVDDATLELVEVIEDHRLVTPSRLIALP